jgi:hypothetical protein
MKNGLGFGTKSRVALVRAAGALAIAMVPLTLGTMGCGGLHDDADTQASATTATPVASADILGFEKSAGWSVSNASPRISERRTQGTSSFALDAPGFGTHLTSQPVSTTAAALASFGASDSVFALDIMLPTPINHPTATAWAQLKVKSTSRGLSQTDLGQVTLVGAPGGVYTTVIFKIPASVRSKLANITCSDLIFDLYIHPPDCPSDTVRVDNLRAKSPSTPPLGAGVAVDLVALHSYGPDVSTPGTASFPVGVVQIPQSFHLKLGSSTGGTAKLELGWESTIAWTCTYNAGNTGGAGLSYDFKSCTGGGLAGDLVTADFARLTIVKGNAAAGPTKIRAQLAGNPLGDTTGRGVIPPMPTWWGDTTTDANTIVNAYSTALNAPKKTSERYITMPTPEFAERSGDGAPRDLLDPNLPPIPNDPPFDKSGHLGKAGEPWDAWWELKGALSFSDANARHTSDLEANLGANVTVWGVPISVASMEMTVHTDNGQVTPTGFSQPSSTGTLHMYLFGAELPGGGSTSAQTGFVYNLSQTQTFDAPEIHVWIFAIQVGVSASAGVVATGDLRVDGFHLNVAPTATIGAHLFGGIDVLIASGGVDVKIQLINVSTPIDGSLTWNVQTDPTVCAATLNFLLESNLTLSTLGGEVDLVAKFGVCPFCDHESYGLYHWKPLPIGAPTQLFSFSPTVSLFPLPASACREPLNVSIVSPTTNAHEFQTAQTAPAGAASRPGGAASGSTIGTSSDVPCQYWTWSSSDPSDVISPVGCRAVITWGNPGSRTIKLSVVDQFGESGFATTSVTVDPAPTGPLPAILSPTENEAYLGPAPISLLGTSTGGVAPVTLSWSFTINDAGPPILIGTGPSPAFTADDADVTLHIILTATDANGASNSTTVDVINQENPR